MRVPMEDGASEMVVAGSAAELGTSWARSGARRLIYALLALLLACSGSERNPRAEAPSTQAGAGGVGAAGSAVAPDAPSAGVGWQAAGGGAAGAAASGGMSAGGAAGGGSAATAGSTAPVADAGSPPSSADPDAGAGASLDVWLAPDGADTNPGTESMPLATLAAAALRAQAGSTIWVAAGSYRVAQTVAIESSGAEGTPIRIFAQPGQRPVFDFMAQPRGESSARGLQISGSYWHVRGIDVINAGDNCIHISGSHNTIERVNTHGCSDTGVQITANSAEAGDATRAAHNTVLNCDSHDNYDAANQGENADGFAAKLYIGPGNVFRGCRAWNNADDGWDLFASDDVVVIENCWAIANGKIGATQNNTNGDGNGFKLGGAARAGDQNMGGAVHEVKGCISVENRACGFVLNNNTQLPELSMCGGRGDGEGLLCSLTNSAAVAVGMSAAEAIAAVRDADGNLPPSR